MISFLSNIEPDLDRVMVGGEAGKDGAAAGGEVTGEAAVEAQSEAVGGVMGRQTGAGIGEAGEQRGADHVAVADDGGAGGQVSCDLTELDAVQKLAVGEMDIGDGEGFEVENLTDAADDDAALEGQVFGLERGAGPSGEAVMAAGENGAGVVAADAGGQGVDGGGGFLHEQEVGRVGLYESRHVVEGRAGGVEEVPGDEVHGVRCSRWRQSFNA